MINILQNAKLTLKNLPKTFKVVQKWRNLVTLVVTDFGLHPAIGFLSKSFILQQD